MISVIGLVWRCPDTGEDEEQTSKRARGPYAKITSARGLGDPVQPRLQLVLIAIGAVPAPDIVVTYRSEIRKVRAEDICDERVPGTRVLLVIEVSLMQDQISPFLDNQLQHGPRALAQPLVRDERDRQRRP